MSHLFTTGGANARCGHAVFITGTPLQSDLDDLCAQISARWEVNFKLYRSALWTYSNGELKYSDGTAELLGTSTVNAEGDVTGEACPASVAMVLSTRTADFYRGGHGRIYVPGWPSSSIASVQDFDAGIVAGMESSWADFLSDISGMTTTNITSVAPGVIRRHSGGVPLAPPTFSPYVGTKAQRRVCTQRRRLGRLAF